MATGRLESDWAHTSSLMALLANCHRDPKAKPYRPADFNPFAVQPKPAKVPVRLLKDVFIDRTF